MHCINEYYNRKVSQVCLRVRLLLYVQSIAEKGKIIMQFITFIASLHAVLNKIVAEASYNFGYTKGASTMNRLLVVILLLTALLPAVTPSLTIAADPVLLQDFDRDACYSNCPCAIGGMEQACADCKQKCDDEFWKDFDEKLKNKKGN